MALVREAQEILGRRQVPESAMLMLAPTFLDVADDLATDIASPDVHRAREIAAVIRTCISSQGTYGIRGDVSGIDAIVDETSRSICSRQLPIIDLVHLVAVIVQGVEEGLRALLSDGLTSRRARDGPSLSGDLADAPVRPVPTEPHAIDRGSSARALLSAGAEVAIKTKATAEPSRSAPMTPDYDDP